ncbi:MAG TPA: hypothetical protein VK459_11345, partial [Polyangiaceae bacterium]|nr:hypothetical protein [Polyangiaceae bacterium]
QPKVPAELLHFCHQGLAKDPAERHSSAACMIDLLQRTLEGRLDVLCHVTLMKRALREATRFVDRWPRLSLLAFAGVLAALVFSSVELVRRAIA